MEKFTKEQHIKSHTKKENMYNNNCAYCVYGDYRGEQYYKKENK